jgi:hypothetical protein
MATRPRIVVESVDVRASPAWLSVPLLIVGTWLGLCASPAAAAEWEWPVRGSVIERFRVGPDRFAAGQHRGIDIAAPAGTAVRSACAGTVTFAGFVGAGGRTVSVRCGVLTATYQYLAAIVVWRGESVAAGTQLGAVGRSGRPRSAEAHLHFGVHRTANRHAYLDPLSLLRGGERSRPRVPLFPSHPRPGGRVPLGPPPLQPARPRLAGVPAPRALPVAAGRRGPPLVTWVGVGLALIGLPGLGLRRRRRAAARRSASAQRVVASSPGPG